MKKCMHEPRHQPLSFPCLLYTHTKWLPPIILPLFLEAFLFKYQMETQSSDENSLYFTGCIGSLSWCPTNKNQYSQSHLLSREAQQRGQRWQSFIRRLVKEGRSICSTPKRLTFRYDAASCSKNFDDGCWKFEDGTECWRNASNTCKY